MKSIKLLALDLDGTLADVNQPINKTTLDLLEKITRHGVHVAILSGKPTAYLAGLGRQLGIENLILSGENGAEVQFGLTYPPKAFYSLSEKPVNHTELLTYLHQYHANSFWLQPNQVNFSVFAKPDVLAAIHPVFKHYSQQQEYYTVYLHSDCVELVDSHVSKGTALQFIINKLNITATEVCAIGDGENDIALLTSAEFRIAIRNTLAVDNLQIFSTIDLALTHIVNTNLSC